MRKGVERFTSFWLFTAVILLGISRSKQFKLKELFGLIDGDIHRGYVVAYGCIAIGMIIFGVHMRLRELLDFRESILEDLGCSDNSVHLSNAVASVEYMLRLPFRLPDTNYKYSSVTKSYCWLSDLMAYFPLLLISAAYVISFCYYFGLRHENSEEINIGYLMWGHDNLRGFNAYLDIVDGEKHIFFLNAPVQTWINIIGFIYVLYVICWWSVKVFWKGSPYRTHTSPGWLSKKTISAGGT
ncbi:hypothetical protein Pan54_41420 [Rubinisphaera italica]|uniref:Uncharacterized protein n=2 Tax=Rubinisphaera italica TaxID=2527969 RepID=A0A5C5XLG5_9PLAN|nr:hypothetical protein Pan54_41420 [Rubinisphaera italica]